MATPAAGFRSFAILWSGQFVSLAGSALTGFALGVYVYQLTGSVTTLGLIYALGLLPMILASPFTGALVDRWGAQRALVVSTVAAMCVQGTLMALLVTHLFAVWQVYVIVVVNSLLGGLQIPAFESSVPLLVPTQHLGRANGMRMFALAASQVMAPAAAGALLLTVHIGGIVLLDCVSYAAAIVCLLCVRIPRVRSADGAASAGWPTLLGDFAQAWRYVAARKGLLGLLVFIGALNFCAAFADILITPLVLAFASTRALGTILSIGGIGMVATSIVMSAWGGPRRRIRGVLGFSLVIAAGTVIGSVRPDVTLVAVGAFGFLGSMAVVGACYLNIWQTKVPADLLGRAMALQNMVASAPQLIAYALAGVITDRVFQPMVGRDHVRSAAVAALVGSGPGRGIALLLMLVGVLIAVCVALAYAYPHLRHLEDELPDMTAPDAAADEMAGAGVQGSSA
jgi:MFS transporter, DHA3 family, macrolide efflux protein